MTPLRTRFAALILCAQSLRLFAGDTGAPPPVETPPAEAAVYKRAIESPTLRLVRRALKKSPHQWNENETHQLAQNLERASRRTGIKTDALVALILIESHFRPAVIGRNRNGTHDLGLTQQNSRYVQIRCRREFGRACSPSELLRPDISIRLMAQTLNRCGRAFRTTEQRVLCYNSWRRAYSFRRTGYRPAYLRKFNRTRRALAAVAI